MRSLGILSFLMLAAVLVVGCGDGGTDPDAQFMVASLGGTMWRAGEGGHGTSPPSASLSDGEFHLIGSSHDEGSDVTRRVFMTGVPATVGSYELGDYPDGPGPRALVTVISYNPFSGAGFNSRGSLGGTVTIIILDHEARQVAGTFSFDAKGYRDGTPIGTMAVRNGSFRLNF